MPRIYLDTNVFSNLKNDKDSRFHELNDLLKIYKKKLSFYFSVAHIADKRKDKTDFKFEDFKFMETLVGDNYIAYDPIERITSLYLATPLMVFEDNEGDELEILKDFFEPKESDNPIIRTLKTT
ncbi:MAG TPA: hypothetical protein VIM77_07785, partial [Mucilaginibacter sp.]